MPPKYINRHMTEEELLLFFRMRDDRLVREAGKGTKKVRDVDLFKTMGVTVKPLGRPQN